MLKTLLFLLMAGGLVMISLVAYRTLNPPPPPVQTVEKVQVLAANGTLRVGTLLKPDDLEIKEVEEGAVPTGARKDSPAARSELFGAMVRQTLLPHQVILPADVMRPGDHGFLAAVLTPGKRAASVGVDAVTGTAGLIWPGDHVDLILTQQIDDPSVSLGRRLAAETVLKDVRVIAVDQQLVQGGAQTGADTAAQSRTVTLEVSPEDVEKVAVATRLGRLSLAVRPVDAGAPADAADRAVTYSQDVSTAIGNMRKPEEQSASHVLHVYSGTSDKEYPF